MYKYSYNKLLELAKTEKGQELVEQFRKCYNEKYKGKKANYLTYSYFKDFYRTGDRFFYEAEYFEKRRRLMLLQLLALDSDEYLEELEQVLFEICEEFTWALPAHCRVVTELGRFDYTKIDLSAAETAFYLSETAYVFKDKLSLDILDRIQLSLKTKIVDNFENGTFFFDRTSNNWAAVCLGSIGITYLYAFPERFDIVKERIFTGMERFLSGIEDDGYCSEGFTYWRYGFGFFVIFYDMYVNFTDKRPAILENEKIKKTLEYGVIAQLSKKRFLPFADGGTLNDYKPSMWFCAGEQLFNVKLNQGKDYPLPDNKALGFRALYSVVNDDEGEILVKGFKYYDKGQVYINKKEKYSFTAKGGNNNEKHNHNDIGVFHLIKGEDFIVADLGCGEYTKGYFNNKGEEAWTRYSKEVFVCSSLSHSVPIVNGDAQKTGSEYTCEILESNENTFKLDIKKAYAQDIDKLIVEYSLLEDRILVNYTASGVKEFIVRFVSVFEPKLVGNDILIKDSKIVSKNGIIPTVSKVEYNNHDREKVEVYTIDYKTLDTKDIDQTFEIII